MATSRLRRAGVNCYFIPGNAGSPAQTSKKAIYWIASLALAGVLLSYSLRGIEWRQVWITLRSARVLFVVLGFTLMTGSLFLRSYRWRVLLSAEGPVSVPLAFWA